MFAVEMSLLASFMNLAGPDLIVILLIVLVLFGAKKLPELARGMGQAVKEFQKAKDEFNDELHKAGKSDTQIAKPDVKPAESTVARTDSQVLLTSPRRNRLPQSFPATKPTRFSFSKATRGRVAVQSVRKTKAAFRVDVARSALACDASSHRFGRSERF